MKKIETKIKDCFLFETERYSDNRGYFQETFQKNRYDSFLPSKTNFVQDNLSYSIKNVLRGIHIQLNNPQAKLVRVVKGEVFDVAVDLRPNSSTFGLFHTQILNDENNLQFWIPNGFGHAFVCLSEYAILEYKCSDYYNPSDEICIKWDDSQLNIDWPNRNHNFNISDKDLQGMSFQEYCLKISDLSF